MSHRTLNLRLLIISSVACLLLGGGVATVHSWQISKTSQAMLAYALKQEEQSNWLKAAEYLDRYLRIAPGDLDARVRLATDYAKGAETLEQKLRAVELHYSALSFGKVSEERLLRERLTELLLETGRSFEALNEARRLVALQSEAPPANRLLALASFRQFQKGALASADFKKLRRGLYLGAETFRKQLLGQMKKQMGASGYVNHLLYLRRKTEGK